VVVATVLSPDRFGADISELGVRDIADFLRGHPPFDALDDEMLERVAASAEVDSHAAGAAILDSAEETSRYAHVLRRGSVELLIDGRLLDLLGEGEMFGFASLLEEAPLGFRRARRRGHARVPDSGGRDPAGARAAPRGALHRWVSRPAEQPGTVLALLWLDMTPK
jgi:hypothetical protein